VTGDSVQNGTLARATSFAWWFRVQWRAFLAMTLPIILGPPLITTVLAASVALGETRNNESLLMGFGVFASVLMGLSVFVGTLIYVAVSLPVHWNHFRVRSWLGVPLVPPRGGIRGHLDSMTMRRGRSGALALLNMIPLVYGSCLIVTTLCLLILTYRVHGAGESLFGALFAVGLWALPAGILWSGVRAATSGRVREIEFLQNRIAASSKGKG
jgi:hypothetical protein